MIGLLFYSIFKWKVTRTVEFVETTMEFERFAELDTDYELLQAYEEWEGRKTILYYLEILFIMPVPGSSRDKPLMYLISITH